MSAHAMKSSIVGGVVIGLLGAIFFSTKAIFVKLAYAETQVDAVTLLALRMVFSLPFFLISALATSTRVGNIRFTPAQWMYVAAIGCLGYYVSSLLDFLGLQYVSAGIERLILFIYPTMVLILSALFFKEKISNVQWLAVAITYVGMSVAFVGEVALTDASSHFYLGAAYIFACAITYALYIVGSGRMIPVIGAAKFNSYAMSFACLAVLLHFALTAETSLLNQPTIVYLYGFLMGVISTVIPSFLVTEGIKRMGSENASIVGSIGPVSTIIQANILLGEPIYAAQIVGTALILCGVLVIARSSRRIRA